MGSSLLIEMFGTFARAIVVFLAGTMVSHRIWTEDQATRFGAYLTPIVATALVSVALALYRRYRSRLAVDTALALPAGSTGDELKEAMKYGPPSAGIRSTLTLLAVAVVFAAPSACSLSGKGKVVAGYESVQTALESLQDAELAAYRSGVVKELTPAVHARTQRAFAAAFDAQEKLAGPLKLWRAGDPLPVNYAAWLQAVNGVLDAVDAWLPPNAPSLTAKAVAWAKTALAIVTQLGQVAPARLDALANGAAWRMVPAP